MIDEQIHMTKKERRDWAKNTVKTLSAEVGPIKAGRIFAAIMKRLATMPKDKFLSEDEMSLIVLEETEKVVSP